MSAIIQFLARLFCRAVPKDSVTDLSPPAPSAAPLLLTLPPILSRSYLTLKVEYQQCFDSCAANLDAQEEISCTVEQMLDDQQAYRAVGLGIPWWFIAIIHQMESGGNFKTHLHNGDSLTARTKNVPAGRPLKGEPPFTWLESARDALDYAGFACQSDWSLPKVLYRLEAYNGFGYRRGGRPFTPYLWGRSNISTPGKFSSDGVFDHRAVSKQIGAAVILKSMGKLWP